MDIKASGRSALIIAAGLTVGLWCVAPATPSFAAPQAAASDSGSPAKPAPKKKAVKHHAKPAKAKQAQAKPSEPNPSEAKQSEAKSVVKSPVEEGRAADAQTGPKPLADASGALPASIANANAQATPAEAAQAQPTPSTEASQAAAPAAAAGATNPAVIAADQVNDLDRAATDAPQLQAQMQPQQPAAAETAATPQPQADTQAKATTHDDDAWDKASLIGKIFIAAGGLLTLASAARMFMA
ncbi:hypothetical protein DYI24_17440 [Rhodopseudomonas sp. BR0C11]|uniref:hypothetical protein n=1 Tax=Rhodopseudomonas sp. BR0C11 TaxID=2269370 RepID=UPI0013DF8260|nr:hypothetical protein [Rhodopseudomonas sp. BR0C11]NEV78822.1 hypothetical protein [Rhodopseudomonas sp. BR0C11]